MLTMEGGESWGKQKSIQPTASSYQLSAFSFQLTAVGYTGPSWLRSHKARGGASTAA